MYLFNSEMIWNASFPSQIQKVLDELNGEWYAFQQCLTDSDIMLKKSKEKFKTGLLLSAEEFKKTVSILLDEFRNKGPFNSDISTDRVSKITKHFAVYAVLIRYSIKQWKIYNFSLSTTS